MLTEKSTQNQLPCCCCRMVYEAGVSEQYNFLSNIGFSLRTHKNEQASEGDWRCIASLTQSGFLLGMQG